MSILSDLRTLAATSCKRGETIKALRDAISKERDEVAQQMRRVDVRGQLVDALIRAAQQGRDRVDFKYRNDRIDEKVIEWYAELSREQGFQFERKDVVEDESLDHGIGDEGGVKVPYICLSVRFLIP